MLVAPAMIIAGMAQYCANKFSYCVSKTSRSVNKTSRSVNKITWENRLFAMLYQQTRYIVQLAA
jgi:hypothetical protein